jgi:Trp operon repressor
MRHVQRPRNVLFARSHGQYRSFVGILGLVRGQENARGRLRLLGSSSDQDAVAERSQGATQNLDGEEKQQERTLLAQLVHLCARHADPLQDKRRARFPTTLPQRSSPKNAHQKVSRPIHSGESSFLATRRARVVGRQSDAANCHTSDACASARPTNLLEFVQTWFCWCV